MTTMTYDQATEQAVKLHNQGMTYPKIEEHFRAIGYTSPRTKKAVGSLAIRHMVTQYEAREKAELKQEEAEVSRPLEMVSPVRDILAAVEKVLDIDGISASIKLKMVKNLLANDEDLNPSSKRPVRRVRPKNLAAVK